MARVVIAGAGYGGVMTGKRLERAGLTFTIVNKHSYHQFITWLHEAAGGRRSADDYKIEITDIFRDPACIVIKDEIIGLDRTACEIRGRRNSYPYDYAIIALGSAPEFFGIPGLAEHSLQLRSVETARQIHARIESEFTTYKMDGDRSHLRIVIGGAGLTGIEFAGELIDWLPDLCNSNDIDLELPEVLNLEAAPTILSSLPEHLQIKARSVLEKKGVQIRTGAKIVKVDRRTVHLESGEDIVAGTIVWTGGVKAHPLLSVAGFTCDRRGRAKVNDFLQSIDDERVFVVGDCAAVTAAGKPLPPTAQLAAQMGAAAGANIAAALRDEPLQTFQPKIRGTLASLGRSAGVGVVAGVPTSGSLASMAKELTKVKYLIQLGGLRMISRNRRAFAREQHG
ncbi:MAG: NAD(P)/FAD-dependent oxidoreductase [Bacilli bacterium]